jgi:hypothetical protein
MAATDEGQGVRASAVSRSAATPLLVHSFLGNPPGVPGEPAPTEFPQAPPNGDEGTPAMRCRDGVPRAGSRCAWRRFRRSTGLRRVDLKIRES